MEIPGPLLRPSGIASLEGVPRNPDLQPAGRSLCCEPQLADRFVVKPHHFVLLVRWKCLAHEDKGHQ